MKGKAANAEGYLNGNTGCCITFIQVNRRSHDRGFILFFSHYFSGGFYIKRPGTFATVIHALASLGPAIGNTFTR